MIYVVFFTLVLVVILLMLLSLYLDAKHRDGMFDDMPVMDEMQEETYNNRPLWIREEERDVWDKMTREQKRETVRATEKLIKKGELIVHTDENGFTGLLTRKEAKQKGYI